MQNIFLTEKKELVDNKIGIKKKAALETRMDPQYEAELQKNMDQLLAKIKTQKDKERALEELKTIKKYTSGTTSISPVDISLFLVPIPFLIGAKAAYGNATPKKRSFIKKLNQTIKRVEALKVK